MRCVVALCETIGDANQARHHWGLRGYVEVETAAGVTYDQLRSETWRGGEQLEPEVMVPGQIVILVKE